MKTKIELTPLMDELIAPLFPLAATYRCQLKNNIPTGLTMITNKDAFAFIVNRLVQLIIQSSYNSNISISHVYEKGGLSIRIAGDNNSYNGFISGKMEKHQSIIKRAGCCLRFEFKEKKDITIILHFNARDQEFNAATGS